MATVLSECNRSLCCHSATAHHIRKHGGIIFGVVEGTVEKPRVNYLSEAVPAETEVLNLASSAKADEVFRMASPCLKRACNHFRNNACGLVTRITNILPADTPVPKCVVCNDCV